MSDDRIDSASEIEKESPKSTGKRGGARPGAGRPKGGKNALTKQLEDMCRVHGSEAVKVLRDALKDESVSARITAATAILDRGYGKPRQALEHTGEEGGPIEVYVTHEIVDASGES